MKRFLVCQFNESFHFSVAMHAFHSTGHRACNCPQFRLAERQFNVAVSYSIGPEFDFWIYFDLNYFYDCPQSIQTCKSRSRFFQIRCPVLRDLPCCVSYHNDLFTGATQEATSSFFCSVDINGLHTVNGFRIYDLKDLYDAIKSNVMWFRLKSDNYNEGFKWSSSWVSGTSRA